MYVYTMEQIIRDYNENQRRYHQNIQQMLDIMERERPRATSRFTNGENIINTLLRYYGTQNIRTREYQDVVVRPTQQQIEHATESILYDNNIEYSQCSITLEPFQSGEEICRIKHCLHCFKKTAILDWFNRNVRCPVCRYDIRDYHRTSPIIEEPAPESDSETEAEQEHDTRPITSRRNPLLNTIQNSIRSLLSGVNNNDELVYTFDFPIHFDASGNFRV